MPINGPIDASMHFWSTVFKKPTEAFKNAADGILYGEKEGAQKWFAPAATIIGASAIVIGALARSPVTFGLGAFNLSMGLGYYQSLGEERRDRGERAEAQSEPAG